MYGTVCISLWLTEWCDACLDGPGRRQEQIVVRRIQLRYFLILENERLVRCFVISIIGVSNMYTAVEVVVLAMAAVTQLMPCSL